MANEKRLIDIEDALRRMENAEHLMHSINGIKAVDIGAVRQFFGMLKPVDAVEVADMREFAADVAYQFGYYCQNRGRLHITHGGLSTLEWAFDILGWENPHPVPECECEIDGCHEHATCGSQTADGYKRMCGRHMRERSTNV